MRKSPDRARAAGIGIAAVALLTAFIATPSQAAEVAPAEPRVAAKELTAADRQMLAQRPFVEAADRLRATAESPALKGFAGIVLAEDAVVLWWKGAPPAQVRQAVASAGRLAPVRIGSAVHSKAELDQAARSIESWQKQHPDAAIDAVKNQATAVAWYWASVRRTGRRVRSGRPCSSTPAYRSGSSRRSR
jgi:hypothetical protein